VAKRATGWCDAGWEVDTLRIKPGEIGSTEEFGEGVAHCGGHCRDGPCNFADEPNCSECCPSIETYYCKISLNLQHYTYSE